MGLINTKKKFIFERRETYPCYSTRKDAEYVYDQIGGGREIVDRDVSNERCNITISSSPHSDYYTRHSSLKKGLADSRCSLKKRSKAISLTEVPFMVEAFQPLLEQTIDVLEVIPHMPYIDAHEFANVDDQRKAVKMILAKIKSLDEPGKWQTFLHALNYAEYEYIVSLLRGETEEDHSVNRNLLRLFTPQIMNRIDPDEFIDHLLEKGVINERDMEEVRCEKNRRGAIAASFMLLHKVPRRVSDWFSVFLDVLGKCGLEDLIQHFKIPEVSVCSTHVKKPLCEDEHLDYLTPVYDNRRKHHNLPPQRPSPPPLPVRTRNTIVKVYDQKQKTRAMTELELLKERNNSLQRKVEHEKLIRHYKLNNATLEKQYKKLKADNEDSNNDNSEDSSLEQLAENEYFVLNPGPREDNEITGVLQMPTDIDRVDVDITEEPDYVNENYEQENTEQKDALQRFSMQLTDMKQEISSLRDNVKDAVLNSVINVITGSTTTGENTYMTIGAGETILPSPVQLYNTSHRQMRGLLSPMAHKVQRHYSIDSALFSAVSYI